MARSGRRVVAHQRLDLLLIGVPVFLEEVVCVCLGRRVWIWVVQEVLNAEQNLLYRNGRLPAFLFVQNAKTDSTGRIDVRMEEGWCEFAWLGSAVLEPCRCLWLGEHTFGRLGRIL